MNAALPKRLLICLLCLWLAALARAEVLTLSPAQSGLPANGQADWFVDASGELDAATVLAPGFGGQFSQSAGRSGAGLGKAAYWLRLHLQRPDDGERWWLVVEPLNLYDLQLYLPDDRGGWQRRESGEKVAYRAGRDRDWRQYAFALPPGSGPLTIYVRAQDPGGVSFPVSLWRDADLERHIRNGELILGLIYGLLAGMCAYNLFLAFTLRDATYSWYVGAMLALTLFLAHLHGHTAQFLWPDLPWLVAAGRVLVPTVWTLFLGFFLMSFFATRRHQPGLHRVLVAMQWLYLLILLLRWLDFHALSAAMISTLPALATPLILVLAVRRLRQGFKPAGIFLIGYGVLLGGVLLFLLRVNGVLPPSRLTELSLPLSAGFEALTFSLALASRIKLLQRESAAAYEDELTGLPNRRRLDQQFDAWQQAPRQSGRPYALVALDLDRFKPINDQYGHDVGDQVLRILARRMRSCVRDKDMVARVGGDEFVVLFAAPNNQEAVAHAMERLLAAARDPIQLDGLSLQLSASAGLALFGPHGRSLRELSRHADMALYQAKSAGRDGWQAAAA